MIITARIISKNPKIQFSSWNPHLYPVRIIYDYWNLNPPPRYLIGFSAASRAHRGVPMGHRGEFTFIIELVYIPNPSINMYIIYIYMLFPPKKTLPFLQLHFIIIYIYIYINIYIYIIHISYLVSKGKKTRWNLSTNLSTSHWNCTRMECLSTSGRDIRWRHSWLSMSLWFLVSWWKTWSTDWMVSCWSFSRLQMGDYLWTS